MIFSKTFCLKPTRFRVLSVCWCRSEYPGRIRFQSYKRFNFAIVPRRRATLCNYCTDQRVVCCLASGPSLYSIGYPDKSRWSISKLTHLRCFSSSFGEFFFQRNSISKKTIKWIAKYSGGRIPARWWMSVSTMNYRMYGMPNGS